MLLGHPGPAPRAPRLAQRHPRGSSPAARCPEDWAAGTTATAPHPRASRGARPGGNGFGGGGNFRSLPSPGRLTASGDPAAAPGRCCTTWASCMRRTFVPLGSPERSGPGRIRSDPSPNRQRHSPPAESAARASVWTRTRLKSCPKRASIPLNAGTPWPDRRGPRRLFQDQGAIRRPTSPAGPRCANSDRLPGPAVPVAARCARSDASRAVLPGRGGGTGWRFIGGVCSLAQLQARPQSGPLHDGHRVAPRSAPLFTGPGATFLAKSAGEGSQRRRHFLHLAGGNVEVSRTAGRPVLTARKLRMM